MDKESDFGKYRLFLGTIINIRPDTNPDKIVNHNWPRQRRRAMIRFYFKNILVEEILVPQNASKIFLGTRFSEGYILKSSYFHEQLEISGTSQ